MSSTSLAFALALISSAGISTVASAYPGAKASELQKTVEIQSVCRAEHTPTRQTFLFGYTTPTAAVEKGHCPTNHSVLLRSYPVEHASTKAAEATGNSVFHSTASEERLGQARSFSMNHRVEFNDAGVTGLAQNLEEARMTDLQAKLQTASPQNPVKVSFDYSTKSMTAMERTFKSTEQSIKIVAVCESEGNTFGYTVAGAPRNAQYCPEVSQFKLSAITERASVGWFNFADEWHGPRTNRYVVEIRSQFGLPLFSTPVSAGTFTKTRRDFLTASPEHPLTVTVDQSLNTVISIVPSISPYAL